MPFITNIGLTKLSSLSAKVLFTTLKLTTIEDINMKKAIIILSDPKSGGEDALGRLFNGLAAAYDYKTNGDDVSILFQGAGTRWTAEVTKEDHPVHALYKAVEDKVAGVSCGCADVFGAREDAVKNGFDLITNNSVPGTSGLPSLQKLTADGYNIMTF